MNKIDKLILFGLLLIIISCEKSNTKEVIKDNKKTIAIINKIPKIDSSASNEITPTAKDKLPEQISKFIPEGYTVLNFTKGNLNLDSLDDAILILAIDKEETISTSENPILRPLLILIGQPDSIYKLATQNDNIVHPFGYDANFPDCFTQIKIKNGYFSIEHYGGFRQRWSRITTFKYSQLENNWVLHKDGFSTFDALEPEKEGTSRILTKKDFGNISFNEFDINNE